MTTAMIQQIKFKPRSAVLDEDLSVPRICNYYFGEIENLTKDERRSRRVRRKILVNGVPDIVLGKDVVIPDKDSDETTIHFGADETLPSILQLSQTINESAISQKSFKKDKKKSKHKDKNPSHVPKPKDLLSSEPSP